MMPVVLSFGDAHRLFKVLIWQRRVQHVVSTFLQAGRLFTTDDALPAVEKENPHLYWSGSSPAFYNDSIEDKPLFVI